MATALTITDALMGKGKVVTYADLGAENGDPFCLSDYPDKTIQASGTGTVTLQGSANGTNWEPLKNSAGVAISLVAANDEAAVVLQSTLFMRAVNDNATGAQVVITCTRSA